LSGFAEADQAKVDAHRRNHWTMCPRRANRIAGAVISGG
jgi:hypothetical protein